MKENAVTFRRYNAAFKGEAVRMWLASGQAVEVTARAQGLSVLPPTMGENSPPL